MSVKEMVHGDVVVLSLKGSLLSDTETIELRERVKSLASEGFLKIVLDLANIQWVNSAGLGAMIASLTSLTNKGGELRLANITDKIQSLFLITQLVKVFKTFDSVDRAVASFVVDPISGVPLAV